MDEDEKSGRFLGFRVVSEVMNLALAEELASVWVSGSWAFHSTVRGRRTQRQDFQRTEVWAEETSLPGPKLEALILPTLFADSQRIIVQSFCLDHKPVLLVSGGHFLDFDSLKNTWVWKATSSDKAVWWWKPESKLARWLASLAHTALGCGRKGIKAFRYFRGGRQKSHWCSNVLGAQLLSAHAPSTLGRKFQQK